MTIKEAIKAVKEVLPWDDRHYEALQMAIGALEMQDVRDTDIPDNNLKESYEIVDCYVKASIVEVLREISDTMTVIARKMGAD